MTAHDHFAAYLEKHPVHLLSANAGLLTSKEWYKSPTALEWWSALPNHEKGLLDDVPQHLRELDEPSDP